MRRQEVRLGTWNVTGLGNRGVELLDAMEQYKIDVLGVSETWIKEGEPSQSLDSNGLALQEKTGQEKEVVAGF